MGCGRDDVCDRDCAVQNVGSSCNFDVVINRENSAWKKVCRQRTKVNVQRNKTSADHYAFRMSTKNRYSILFDCEHCIGTERMSSRVSSSKPKWTSKSGDIGFPHQNMLKSTKVKNISYCNRVVGCGPCKNVKPAPQTQTVTFKKTEKSKNSKIPKRNKKLALGIAEALLECDTPFVEMKSLPAKCLQKIYHSLHQPQSCQRSFIKRIQIQFKRDEQFRKEIKMHWLDLFNRTATPQPNVAMQNISKLKCNVKRDSPIYVATHQFQDNSLMLKSEKNETKSEKLYCICRTPNDGGLYVFCETCKEWLHPKCVFHKDHLALSLTKEQWKKCNCVCENTEIPYKKNSATVYHLVKGKNITIEAPSIRESSPFICEVTDKECDFNTNTLKNKRDTSIPLHDYENSKQNLISQTSFSQNTDAVNDRPPQLTIDSGSDISIANNTPLEENFELINTLGNYKQNVCELNEKRFEEVYKSFRIKITLDEWNKMIAGRSENKFASPYYSEILLCKLKEIYNCCVPCIVNHYLRKPGNVLKLRDTSENYYEGYVNIYCRHAHCCNCEVSGKISLVSNKKFVEGIVLLSGKRSHFVECVKSRPVKGCFKKKLMEDLQYQPPNSIYRKLQNSLDANERICGAHTYASSQSVLRNLKSKALMCTRYSDKWDINLEVFSKRLDEKNETFVRNISIRPPAVNLYSNEQLKAYTLICRKDIVYLVFRCNRKCFEAT